MPCPLQDNFSFWFFHSIYFGFAIYCSLHAHGCFKKSSGVYAAIKRGEQSWNYFVFFYGICAAILLELINTTQTAVGYKTIITIVDMGTLFYLCFYNSFSRNWIIGFISNAKEKIEK